MFVFSFTDRLYYLNICNYDSIQILVSYKTIHSISLGHFTLHFMPHFHQELFPQITICLIVWWCCSVAKLCPTLCDPMDCSPPGSTVHGILQARILEQVMATRSRGSSQPRDRTCISYTPCTRRWILYHGVTWEALSDVISWLN